MRFLLLAAWLALPGGALADGRATERYASAQLEMAQSSLELARQAAAAGNAALVGSYAWGASIDARLAWAMSDSNEIKVPAARVLDEAGRLVHQAANPGSTP